MPKPSVADRPIRQNGTHSPSPSGDALRESIARSQNHLLDLQIDETYWMGELMVDATLVADMVIFHHWDRSVDKEWERKAINHIFEKQLEDGGWKHLSGRPARGERHGQGLPRTQTSRHLPHRSAYAQGALGCPITRRSGADEHFLETLPRTGRALPLALPPDDSLRGHPSGQVVPREFLGHEQLVPRHARPAGNPQSLQTDATDRRQPRTNFTRKASTSATSSCRRIPTPSPGAISSSASTR